MPILEKGSCLGVLQCINKFEGLFTKEDELMLRMLGDLANTVLKNVVKHKE
jgi:putative methionine-R-sulfoxide reductase with GAF domain